MSELRNNQSFEDEISSRDIAQFLSKFWKLICISGAIGLFSAIGYLAYTPLEYEIQAQIRVGQIKLSDGMKDTESPAAVMYRMKFPAAYSDKTIKVCGLENNSNPREVLASLVRLSTPKGLESVIDFKMRGTSKEQLITCSQAIYESLTEVHNELIKFEIQKAKNTILNYQTRLKSLRDIFAQSANLGSVGSSVYLANQDEFKFLLVEQSRLNAFIQSSTEFPPKLMAPMYISHDHIYPKRLQSVLIGLLSGLFFGALLAFFRGKWQACQASK